MRENPEADQVAAFDIIRPQADEAFLSQIRSACLAYHALPRSGETATLDILYVDKNNTPDSWELNSKVLRKIAADETGKSVIQTVLLVPKQMPFDKAIYRQANPISPQFIYECFFRVFSRKNHCLSNDNKPKAVEVLFKYMKLFDGVDFSTPCPLFDHQLLIDFVNYDEQRVSVPTLQAIAEAYNRAPDNFRSLDDESIARVLEQIEREIASNEQSRREEMERFNLEIMAMSGQKDDEDFH